MSLTWPPKRYASVPSGEGIRDANARGGGIAPAGDTAPHATLAEHVTWTARPVGCPGHMTGAKTLAAASTPHVAFPRHRFAMMAELGEETEPA